MCCVDNLCVHVQVHARSSLQLLQTIGGLAVKDVEDASSQAEKPQRAGAGKTAHGIPVEVPEIGNVAK